MRLLEILKFLPQLIALLQNEEIKKCLESLGQTSFMEGGGIFSVIIKFVQLIFENEQLLDCIKALGVEAEEMVAKLEAE